MAGLVAGVGLGAGAAVWAGLRFMSDLSFGYGFGGGYGFGEGYGPLLYGPFQVLGGALLALLGIGAVVYIAAGFRLRHRDDALRILRNRYARGEIGLEEYQSMSEHLRRG